MGIIINHEIRIPINQPGFNGKYLHHPDDRLVLPFMIQALLVNADGKIVVNPAFVFCVEDARMFFCCRPYHCIFHSIHGTGIFTLPIYH